MELVQIAKVGRPHGYKGSFVATTALGKDSALGQLKTIYIGPSPENTQPFTILDASWMPKGWKITLQEIHSEESLLKIRDHWIYADRKELPAPNDGEYYVQDLVGLSGIDTKTGNKIGVFKELLEVKDSKGNAYQHTWAFESESGEEILIPAVPHYVQSVSLEEKKIFLMNLQELLAE